jgi:hypothetical protein
MERLAFILLDMFFIACATAFGVLGYKQIQYRIFDIDYLGGIFIITSIVFFLASVKQK